MLLQENLLQCYNAVQEMVIDGYESAFDTVASSVTPLNVLDQHFSSSECGMTHATVTATTLGTERDIKRRKLIDYCDNLSVQISRIRQYWWAWSRS